MKPKRMKFKNMPPRWRFKFPGSDEVWFKLDDRLAVLNTGGREKVRVKPGRIVYSYHRLDVGIPRIGQHVMLKYSSHYNSLDRVYRVIGYCQSNYDWKPMRRQPIDGGSLILAYDYAEHPGVIRKRVIVERIRAAYVVSARPLPAYEPSPPTVLGGWWNVPAARFYVFARDTFMSGWGEAVFRRPGTDVEATMDAWVLFPCDSVMDAMNVIRNLRARQEMADIHVCRFLSRMGGQRSAHEMVGGLEYDRWPVRHYRKIDPTKRKSRKNTELDAEKTVVGGKLFLLYPDTKNRVDILTKERAPNWFKPHLGRDQVKDREESIEDAQDHMALLAMMIGEQ